MTEPNATPTEDKMPDNVVPEDEMGRRRRVLELSEQMGDLVSDMVDRAKEFKELGVEMPEWLSYVFNPVDFGDHLYEFVRIYGQFAPVVIDGLLAIATGEDPRLAAVKHLPTLISGAGLPSFLGKTLKPEPVQSTGTPTAGPSPESHAEFEKQVASGYFEDRVAHRRMRNVIARLFAENSPEAVDGAGKADEFQAQAMEVHILLRGAPMQFSGVLSTTPEGTLKLLTPVEVSGKAPVMIEQFFDYADVTSVAIVREVKATVGSRIITSS